MTDDDRLHHYCGAGTILAFVSPVCPVLLVPAVWCYWRAWRIAR